jgi:hypothetical protein
VAQILRSTATARDIWTTIFRSNHVGWQVKTIFCFGEEFSATGMILISILDFLRKD